MLGCHHSADRARRLTETFGESAGELFAAAARYSSQTPETGPLFAGMLVDGIEIIRRRRDFPILRRLIDDGMAPVDAAVALAALLGWEVFGPVLLEAAGAEADDDASTAALAGYVDHLLPR